MVLNISNKECINIFIIQIECAANKNRQTLSQLKQWCNDCGVLNLHHGYYTSIMTSRGLFRHNPVQCHMVQINQSENRNSYSVWKFHNVLEPA